MAVEIEKLMVRIVGDATSYQKMLRDAKVSSEKAGVAVEKVSRRLERVATRLKSAGKSMRQFGRSMSLRITAPLTIIGGLAVRSFAKFDKAMTESTSIMGDKVIPHMKQMRQTALDLSATGAVLQGPEDLAKSYFFLASAGKDAAQSMALLPKVAAFATAGAFDMALATDLLTDAQSALGMTSKNVAEDMKNLVRVSDVLVKANTLANASVQQFSVALTSKAGAALKVYNKTVEEGVAVLAALADQGVKAELAGNALDRIMRLSAKGAIDNAKAHKALGLRVFDSAGKMRNLGKIIKDLEVITVSMSDEQRAIALDMLGFEARVQGVILPLLGTSAAIERYEKELKNAGGTTEDVANKQMKSFSAQMTILKNQITVAGIELGQTLAPMLTLVAEKIKELTKWWGNLDKETKSMIATTGVLLAVMGPVLSMIGTMTWAVGNLTRSWGGLLGLGLTAAFIAVKIAMAGVNAELQATISNLRRMQSGRLRNIASGGDEETAKGSLAVKGITNPSKSVIKAEMARLKSPEVVREALEAEIERLRGMKKDAENKVAKAAKPTKFEGLMAAVTGSGIAGGYLSRFAGKLTGASASGIAQNDLREVVDRIKEGELFLEQWEANLKETTVQTGKQTDELENGKKALEALNKLQEKQTLEVKKRLDMENLHNTFLQQGQAIIRQFMTPQEKYLDRVEQLYQTYAWGGFGTETEIAVKHLRRALSAAEKERDDSLMGPEASSISKRIQYSGASIQAARFGSAEAQERYAMFKARQPGGGATSEQQVQKDIRLGVDRIGDGIDLLNEQKGMDVIPVDVGEG